MTDTTQNTAGAAPKPAAPAADAKPSTDVRRSSTLITNPPPPEGTVPEPPPEKLSLPQSTLDEMEAGKKALERNRPVAKALETARENPAPKSGA